MTTATAPAVEKRKKPWTKARVIDLIIDIFCFVIVGAASLTCILPFIHILAKSLSDNAYVVANRVILLPMSDAGINLDAYNKVFHDPTIMQSLWVTALVTVVFTAIGMEHRARRIFLQQTNGFRFCNRCGIQRQCGAAHSGNEQQLFAAVVVRGYRNL